MNVNYIHSSEKKVKWSNDLRRIEVDPFTAPTGPTLTLPTCPITTFLLFFTESLFELIAVETNRYAQTCMGEEEYTKWTNVTIDELKAYIGFKILMGIIRLPSLYDYWKKDPYYHYGPIANRISRDRFMEIGRYLHFVDNSTLAPPGSDEYDRLGKVRPVLEQLSKQFTALYNPSRDCSIDEAMIPFKGRSSMKQYIPKKPIKRGFKVWTRADSKNGFVSEFQVYVGKKKEVERRLGARVVKDLTRKIVGKNHHVYCDNFFTSIPLFQDLLHDKIYACGTIRSNREFFPQDFKSDLKKGFKKRGEYKLLQSGNLVIALWQDTKVFTAISTNSQPNEIVEVKRKQKNGEKQLVQCPELIAKYNENMGGVDKNDQLRQYYSIRARGRKCYKYIAYFSIDLAITNSYIFHSLLSEPTFRNLKDFCLNLATQLIGSYNSRKRAGRPSILPSKKFCQSHFPKKPNDKRYRCHYCYTYKKIRKDTQWYCEDCSIHLCHTGKSDDCFILYHTQYL